MERYQFARFQAGLKRLGATGVKTPEFILGRSGRYELRYTPFEHVNRDAKLVIVGITPGETQLRLAYETAQGLLRAGRPESEILVETIKVGAFGGPSMKPNLLKMLRHFGFGALLGIDDVETLWGANAGLLHSTSVVPLAAFKAGKMFAGRFDEVMDSPLFKECFLDCFVPSVLEMNRDALFVGLGSCPQVALDWCVEQGHIRREQVLGAFCHPSGSGGSSTKYYLGETSRDELTPGDPVLDRCDWLDRAYQQMLANTSALRGVPRPAIAVAKPKAVPIGTTSGGRSVATPKPRNEQLPSSAIRATATDQIGAILSEFWRAGYKPIGKVIEKVAAFQSPAGQTIYVVKSTSRMNRIVLMVHPGWKPEALRGIAGVDSVTEDYRYHSNLTRFPKRVNTGKKEIAYGRQISVGTLTDLQRFLQAFKGMRF